MPDLEPITREEMLLDGEDLTPITRKEKFIKRIYDKTQEIPEPVTREEYFLKKAGEGGGGDIDLQTLNVTENGTVNAPSGVAYNKVVTNVPSVIPENAYLLEEYEDVPTDIASFTASDAPLNSLTASIVPVQDLHGYDTPWAGGAGKNKLQNTATTQTKNGVTFIVNDDGTVIINGTAIANTTFDINTSVSIEAGWIFSGSPTGGRLFCSNQQGRIDYARSIDGMETSVTQTVSDARVLIQVLEGNTLNNAKFSPMLRASTETDATFAPYSNICPISGWTNETITVADDLQNPTVTHTTTIPFTDGQGQSVEVFGGSVDVINGTSKNEKTKEGVDLASLTWEVRYTGEVNQTISSSLPSEYLQRTPVFMAEQYVRNGYVGGVASLNNPDERPIGIWNYRGSSSTETSTTTTIYMVVPKDTTPQGKLVYDLATSNTFYSQPTSIKSIDGENNVSASTGQIETLEYFTKEE